MKDLKRTRINFALIVFLFCFCKILVAQQKTQLMQNANFKLTEIKYNFQASNSIILNPTSLNIKTNGSKIKVPLVYDYNKLALFCRLEESVAKNSNLNMRFRLGSVDYVDQLERKPHTINNTKN